VREFEGKRLEFQLWWREPMDLFEELVTDPSLMQHSHFHATRKFVVVNGKATRMRDEPWTADEWWDIEVGARDVLPKKYEAHLMHVQNGLPDIDGLEHGFAPWHIWVDEGRVTTNVSMHPVVVRPAWLDFEVRNGSGNGGGVIIAFLSKVRSPA
jgi:hypothetical protein